VQPPVHIRAVLDGITNPAQILEHDDWFRELFGELNHHSGHSVQNPLRVAFFCLTELVVDSVLAMFLTPFRDRVIALETALPEDTPVSAKRFVETGSPICSRARSARSHGPRDLWSHATLKKRTAQALSE